MRSLWAWVGVLPEGRLQRLRGRMEKRSEEHGGRSICSKGFVLPHYPFAFCTAVLPHLFPHLHHTCVIHSVRLSARFNSFHPESRVWGDRSISCWFPKPRCLQYSHVAPMTGRSRRRLRRPIRYHLPQNHWDGTPVPYRPATYSAAFIVTYRIHLSLSAPARANSLSLTKLCAP